MRWSPDVSGSATAAGPSPARRVLVVDDEEAIVDIMTVALRDAGLDVSVAGDGPSALAAVAEQPPDVVVLDVVLPSMSGMDVLRELRRTTSVPVILVSAIGDVGRRVDGLETGADDYVTKPFSPRELAARVHSVLRRSALAAAGYPHGPGTDGRLSIDTRAREVVVDGRPVALTAKEFDLLAFLADAPRRAFDRDELLREVWASTSQWQDPATVTEHVRRIRQKIEPDPRRPRWIVTVRGVGYRFEP